MEATTRRTTSFRQTVRISASPDEVYDAYVNAQKHAAFTGAAATSDPVPGGAFAAWDGYIGGTFLTLERGRRIVQTWRTSEWPEGAPPSHVEILLEEEGRGTRLTLVHSEVPEEQASEYEEGWQDFYWVPLQEYFAMK